MCDHEPQRLNSEGSAAGMPEHIAQCPDCREAAEVIQYLENLPSDDGPLPSAELILWRAKAAERARLARRSVSAITLVTRISLAVVLLLAIIVCALSGLSLIIVCEIAAFAIVALGTVAYLAAT